jgi:hypothetical protein
MALDLLLELLLAEPVPILGTGVVIEPAAFAVTLAGHERLHVQPGRRGDAENNRHREGGGGDKETGDNASRQPDPKGRQRLAGGASTR